MDDSAAVATFLFTDIEGSTRLWEQEPERMRAAMGRHDALTREAVESHAGEVVKKTGDGVHAAFRDPLDALLAAIDLQLALVALERECELPLRARCGLHAGVFERRDGDYYGGDVNRAARIMAAAHGGQVIASGTVAELLRARHAPGIELADLGTVRLRDLARPERVFQVNHPALRRDFPPLRALEATPNNLRHELTSFVGRERDLQRIAELLRASRLVTLTGLAGLGKSRLAAHAAAQALDDHPDGAWVVDLAPLADERRVAQAVASVLHVKEDAGRPVGEALERFVAERRLLLVLDNCEHLVKACASLAHGLLQAGGGLRILATSREPLRVAGESSYAVAPLAVPSVLAAGEAGALAQDDSVRLFLDRAGAAQPGFALDERNAQAIAAIAHRLDGIPLALELAAARVRAFSAQQIAERLGDRFRLLTRGDPTALPRQQTLRAAIDWSHELLDPCERAVLRRLAVFSGGWTLDAAEAVAQGDGVAPAEAIEAVTRLVEKSLVDALVETERYRFLETVREYARERLEQAGEADAARGRHLRYYAALVEEAKPQLAGRDQASWTARLQLEQENLLGAFAFARTAPDGVPLALTLSNALKRYWMNTGQLEIGHRVAVDAVAIASRGCADFERMRALFDAGQLGVFMGRFGEARAWLEESLAIARGLGRERVAGVLTPLAWAALGEGDLASARRHLEEGLGMAREIGDPRQVSACLAALADVHRLEGRPGEAQPLCEEATRLAREERDSESLASLLLNAAMIEAECGRRDAALERFTEAAALARQTRSQRLAQSLVEVAAGLAAERRRWALAARWFGAAQAGASRTGLQRNPADEAFLAPRIQAARTALARESFEGEAARGRLLSWEQALDEAARLDDHMSFTT